MISSSSLKLVEFCNAVAPLIAELEVGVALERQVDLGFILGLHLIFSLAAQAILSYQFR